MSTPSEDERRVRVDVEATVMTITLDSPHNRNALSRQLVAEVAAALDDAAGDDGVRSVVLTHTGRTFCAGADLSEASSGPGGAPDTEPTTRFVALLEAIVAHPKPVIGRIDGHVRAGGMGLVAACDVAIAGGSATFALTEARLGLAPSVISLTLLPRMDPRAASRWFLTGETFDAAAATGAGLLSEAVETSEELDAAVRRVTDDLATCSPQGLRETKSLVNHGLLEALRRDRGRVVEQSARLFASDEAREGMAAFLERRRPRWVTG